jgi:hypothetical protein
MKRQALSAAVTKSLGAAPAPAAASSKPEASVKVQYRVKNWPEYDRALVRRGEVTVWFEESFLQKHWRPAGNGLRGAPMQYSDTAIQVLLMLKAVYKLPYRALERFARSLVQLMGLDLAIPDHSHLSRRAQGLEVAIPRRTSSAPLHVVVDLTGLKIRGEGEWKVRKHGAGKRRTWRKVHLAVNADNRDVIAVAVTTEAWSDSEMFGELIEQIDGPIAQIDVDGAYDTRQAYAIAEARGARLVVPPRENAVPWEDDHPRTEVLADIARIGRGAWKQEAGYHTRSLAENAMYRLKQLFGDHMASRRFDTQDTEVQARVAVMNLMTRIGMPISVPAGVAMS